VSTIGALARKLPRSIDQGPHPAALCATGLENLLNERDVMNKLIGSVLFAVAAALAAPAMAASHAGGAPMKGASAPADKASGPAKKAEKKEPAKKEMKKDEKK
jgi:hypothetical protein